MHTLAPSIGAAVRPRVLLVEDAESNVRLFRAYFRNAPYDLDVESDGLAAVERVKTGIYSLVLMDVQLPSMSGHQATAAIRRWERVHQRDPTPILALTASAAEAEVDRSRDAGCTAHLVKPIGYAALFEAIGAHLVPGFSSSTVCVQVASELAELVPGFIRDKTADITRILAAADQARFDVVRTLAHQIKGSGGGYGLPKVSEHGRTIEAAAARADGDEVRRVACLLRDYLVRVEIEYVGPPLTPSPPA